MNMKGFHVLIKSYIHPAVLRFALIHADVGCSSRCGSYWRGWVSRQRDRAGPSTATWGWGGSQPLTTHEMHTARPADASNTKPHAHANISAVTSLCVYNCQTRPGTILKAHTKAFLCWTATKKLVYELRQKHACSSCCCSVSNGRFTDAFLGRSQSGVAPCPMSEVTDDCKRRFSLH